VVGLGEEDEVRRLFASVLGASVTVHSRANDNGGGLGERHPADLASQVVVSHCVAFRLVAYGVSVAPSTDIV